MQMRTFGRRPLRTAQASKALRGLGQDRRAMEVLPMQKIRSFTVAAILGFIGLALQKADATVNVYFSPSLPSTIQQDFIASSTGQYLSTLTQSRFQADTYSLTILGKNPVPPSSVTIGSPGTYVVQIATTTKMIYQSTEAINDVFSYGWVDGAYFERKNNIGIVSQFAVNCDSATAWSVPIDSATCQTVIGQILDSIAEKNFTDPVPIPIPPGWGL
jgi:hypothetical protein